ncbi:hypothetical protein B1B_09118 [mine drainage metagenome]|uniref:Uncharacterized protein n=1 Tax=mine drainage metagenome TaxID=410659 RepID=T1A5P8_9ZZZZ
MLDPLQFAISLGLNVALYTTGALLTREAVVRWKKGWGSVLLLGCAYGILEEGLALSTMFNPNAPPVIGNYGLYGHVGGISWVWALFIDGFHAVWSIALPILLLHLALPALRGKSLLGPREVIVTMCILAIDVLTGMVLVGSSEHFWAGPTLWSVSLVVIAILIGAARGAPADLFTPWRKFPTIGPRGAALLGLCVFPSYLLLLVLWRGAGGPLVGPLLLLGILGIMDALFIGLVRRWVGRAAHDPVLVALAAGLIAPLCVYGFIAQVSTGLGPPGRYRR